MTNTNDFSKAKVGDKLWSLQGGPCKVVSCVGISAYPIRVMYVNGKEDYYTANGRYLEKESYQSLFWSKPEIIAPEKPVKMKEVAVEGYAYSNKNGISFSTTYISFGPLSAYPAILTYQIPAED